jgi:outer membrane protein
VFILAGSAGLLGPTLALAQALPTLCALALERDPTVQGLQAQWRAARERVVQAQARQLPAASLNGSRSLTHYDEKPLPPRDFGALSWAVQISQPLLRPDAGPQVEQAGHQLEQARLQLLQAQGEVAQKVVEAFLELMKARDQVAMLQAQHAATEVQRRAALRAFDIGTASVTDLREAEAKTATLAAQMGGAEEDLAYRIELLAELVGQPVAAVAGRQPATARDPALQLPDLQRSDLPGWLDSASSRNAQLRQAEAALEAAEAEIRKARAGHAPSADLSYSYSRNTDSGTATTFIPRKAYSGSWGVSLTVPLFAGFATQSRLREALALRDKAATDVDGARRSVTLAVRQALAAALSATTLARGLEAAVLSHDTAWRANRRAYEVGMRTNAEVLDAEGRLFEARRDLARARYEAWNQYVKLKAASATLGDADLDRIDALFGPAALIDPIEPPVPLPTPPRAERQD